MIKLDLCIVTVKFKKQKTRLFLTSITDDVIAAGCTYAHVRLIILSQLLLYIQSFSLA